MKNKNKIMKNANLCRNLIHTTPKTHSILSFDAFFIVVLTLSSPRGRDDPSPHGCDDPPPHG